ncbi:aldolase catalytic domain-containing protein [candidate division KSB1 bacterium]|nr:aldolase catalytic domain-containing protein [candidate division KSB1 bacterium]
MSELKKKDSNYSAFGRWVNYRSEIKLLDCTIRDGGLMNKHLFGDDVVKAVYTACVDGGIDYMELGYKASEKIFSRDDFGPWKFCSEDDIRRIVGENETKLKLSAMADTERTDYHKDILPKEQSVLDMIRVATYIHQIPSALGIVQDAAQKGYETTLNLMAVSTVPEKELDEALELVAESDVKYIYLVDSFGSLYSEQIQYLMGKYLRYANANNKQIGMHAHNNQQLAFANTIEALILGANILDGSMAGLGRGAGNCPTESLLGFLHNPKFRLRPVLKCIQEQIEPMREKVGWGFDIPYMITGVMNRHPRAAIEFNETDERGNYVKFFDKIVDLD